MGISIVALCVGGHCLCFLFLFTMLLLSLSQDDEKPKDVPYSGNVQLLCLRLRATNKS